MTNEQKRVIVIAIIAVIAVALAGRVVAARMRRHIGMLQQQIEECEKHLDQAGLEISTNGIYLKKWQDIRGFQDQKAEDRLNEFGAHLQELARESSLISRTQYIPTDQPMADDPAFKILTYKRTFHADIEELVDFLARLDSSYELLCAEKVTISRLAPFTSRYDMRLPSTKTAGMLVEISVATPAGHAVEAEKKERANEP